MKEIMNLPLHERAICILANDKTKEELNAKTDWIDVLDTSLNHIKLGRRLWQNRKNLKNTFKKKEVPYPIFDINEVRGYFKFPPSHPQNGIAYATSEIDDKLYIPLASFHKYMYESKMAAFTELCASLGAKNCRIVYAEENEKDVTGLLKLQNIPTNAGLVDGDLDFGYDSKKTQDVDVFFSFPFTNSIKKYDTVWMNGEPTWVTLQKIRLENDIERYTAEFNYQDDMGVSANVASSLNGVGVNIGGTYKDFKKIKYKFEVEFWPK